MGDGDRDATSDIELHEVQFARQWLLLPMA